MRDDDKTDLPGWLGLRKIPDLTKARWLGPLLTFGAVLVVGGLFLLALVTAFTLLSSAAFGSLLDDPRSALGVGGVTVALIGAPFVIWRSVVAQKTVTLQEQGHITDRINKAVEGLGAEKTVKRDGEEYTQPNLEVRIGAIYALERIAQDSDRDHVQIMEILCAYIRQNAPTPKTDDWPELKMYESEEDGPLESDWEKRLEAFREEQAAAKAVLAVREDIQTALTVIGRRKAKQRRLEAGRGDEAVFPFDRPCPSYDGPYDDHDPAALNTYEKKLEAWKETLREYKGYRLNLRGADLRGADLNQLNLKGAKLTGTYLQGADLGEARLQGAGLREARLQGADLEEARLQGAGLREARLQGADLGEARLQGADLGEARLQGAGLGEARLQGADLWKVRLQGADLGAARLQAADLGYAQLQGADLRIAPLQGAHLDQARLQGAGLRAARLQGAHLGAARLDTDTDLSAATLRGATAESVDYTDIAQIAVHVGDMFADASVTLPGGHGPGDESWPPHWPKFELDFLEFDKEWQEWLDDPDSYRPPDPPKSEDTA